MSKASATMYHEITLRSNVIYVTIAFNCECSGPAQIYGYSGCCDNDKQKSERERKRERVRAGAGGRKGGEMQYVGVYQY